MVRIRRAEAADVEELTRLRLEFLRETAQVAQEHAPALMQATRSYFARALPAGEFIAFIAEHEGQIIATSGLVPFQRPPSQKNLAGREAYLLNMYTVAAWRRQGVASTLLAELITFARDAGIGRILLYATTDGRALYERAGFVPRVHEMHLSL
jgi:GNAT superfamily N-acetyltransferase